MTKIGRKSTPVKSFILLTFYAICAIIYSLAPTQAAQALNSPGDLNSTPVKTTINSTTALDGITLSGLRIFKDPEETERLQASGIAGWVKNTTDEDLFFTLDLTYYSQEGSEVIEQPDLQTSHVHFAPKNSTVQFSDLEEQDFFGRHFSHLAPVITAKIHSVTPNYLNTTPASFLNETDDYVYDRYHVDIKITRAEQIQITETALANFRVQKHGIIRHIPRTYSSSTLGDRLTRITDISVNQNFTRSTEDDYLNLKIGDADRYVRGEQEYIIKYTYNIDKDKNQDFDEFYHNIIQDTVKISNASFTIEFPRDFDVGRIGFTSGETGSTANHVIFYYDNNTVYGWYDGILENGAITIRTTLQDNYFDNPGLAISPAHPLAKVAIPVIVLLTFITLSLYFFYGRRHKLVEPVAFYPPNNISPLEAQFYYQGSVDNRGALALLPALAQKGFIAIDVPKKRDFTIKKLKDCTGDNEHEKTFFDGLFADGEDSVTKKELNNKFYKTLNKITSSSSLSVKLKAKIFDPKLAKISVFMVLILIATTIFTIVTLFTAENDYSYHETLSVLAIFSFVFFIITYTFAATELNSARLIAAVIFAVFVFIAEMIFVETPETALIDPVYFTILHVFLLSSALQIAAFSFKNRRSAHGNEMLGKVRGFRNFLVTAEKDRLEQLVEQNPSYFYDILPYTYALGVSDKWMKNFEGIDVSPPDWYHCHYPFVFSISNFNHEFTKTMSQASTTMSSSPSSGGSSSGYSGGGFSGGGGGGGGSSSW